jgi:hypothetical protein
MSETEERLNEISKMLHDPKVVREEAIQMKGEYIRVRCSRIGWVLFRSAFQDLPVAKGEAS